MPSRNRLMDLESTVAPTRKRPKPPAPAHAPQPAPEVAVTPRVFQLPDRIEPASTDKAHGTWAAAYTMMASWRSRETRTIDATIGELDPRWHQAYNNDSPLSAQDGVDFVATTGLVAKPEFTFTVDAIYDALTESGPLWAIVNARGAASWSQRAWIITGIAGDSSPTGTTLRVIDASNGQASTERLQDFRTRLSPDPSGVASIVHWPKGVRAVQPAPDVEGNVIPLNLGSAAFSAAPSTQAPGIDKTIAGLVAQGANEAEIRAFLAETGMPGLQPAQAQSMPAYALDRPPGVTVTLPGGHVLDGWRATAFKAGLHTTLTAMPTGVGNPLALILNALPALANRYNVTIGVGPSVAGGMVAGANLGVGIIYAPGNRIGFYGSIGGVLGAIFSISATLQVTVVKGGPENFSGESVLAGASVDLGAGPTIGAHAIFSMSGEFQGVTGEVGLSLGLSPFEAFVQYQYTAGTLSYARQAAAGTREFDIKLRVFIPAPAVDGPGINPMGGDGRGFHYSAGTSRADIHAKVTAGATPAVAPTLTIIDRRWGESTEYNQSDVHHPAGKPRWYKAFRGTPAPIRRATLPVTSSNLSVTARNVSMGGAHAVRVKLHVEGAMPIMRISPNIDADLSLYLTNPGGGSTWHYFVRGDHDGFPAYELYLDRRLIYSHDPISRGQTPLSLLPPSEFSVSTPARSI